jgi:hypothetical protein
MDYTEEDKKLAIDLRKRKKTQMNLLKIRTQMNIEAHLH